jgi:hypothetical protein
MITAERVYRVLLRAYPPRFLRSYEREMLLFFRQRRREDSANEFRFWGTLGSDIARSAPRQWREQFTHVLHTGDAIMKAMAIVAMLVGGVDALNALAEARASGFGGHDALSQVGLALAILAGAVMLAAGIALLRRGRDAASLANLAGIGAICVFAFIGLARPMLSGFAMLLGIGFPVALLIFLFAGRGNGMTKPAVRL